MRDETRRDETKKTSESKLGITVHILSPNLYSVLTC